MAAGDARPVLRKNVAARIYFPILDADGDLVSGASGLDSEVSLDGAAFSDCTNEATEIGSSGIYYLDLTAGETNADAIAVIVKTSTSGAKTTPMIFYPEEAGDLRLADNQKVDVHTLKTQALTVGAAVTIYAHLGEAAANVAQTGDSFARIGAPSGASVSADVLSLLNRLTSARAGYLDNVNNAALQTTVAQTGDSFTRLGAPSGASLSADLLNLLNRLTSTRAGYLDVLADWLNDGRLDALLDAIKAKSDLIPASPAAVGSEMTLTSGERSSIAAALLDLADAIEAGLTLRQAMRLLAASGAGKISGADGEEITIRNAVADSKNRIVAEVDEHGNRSSVTYDLT